MEFTRREFLNTSALLAAQQILKIPLSLAAQPMDITNVSTKDTNAKNNDIMYLFNKLDNANDLEEMSKERYWLLNIFKLSKDDLFLAYEASVSYEVFNLGKVVNLYLKLNGQRYKGAAIAYVAGHSYLRIHESEGCVNNGLYIPERTVRVESKGNPVEKFSLTIISYDQTNHQVTYNEKKIVNLEKVVDLRDQEVKDTGNIIPEGEPINDLFSGIFNLGLKKYQERLANGLSVKGFAVSRNTKDSNAKPRISSVEVKRQGTPATQLYSDASNFFARKKDTVKVIGEVDEHFIPLVGDIEEVIPLIEGLGIYLDLKLTERHIINKKLYDIVKSR